MPQLELVREILARKGPMATLRMLSSQFAHQRGLSDRREADEADASDTGSSNIEASCS